MRNTELEYGYKGKGSTAHLLTDGEGNPLGAKVASANVNERKQAVGLIKGIKSIVGRGIKPIFLEVDKRYDGMEFRVKLLENGIYPLIPYRGNRSRIASWVKRV